MVTAIDSALNITSKTTAFGEGETVIRAKNLNVSVEKDSVEAFSNKTEIIRDGFVLDLSNGTFDNITEREIELQVCYVDKNNLIDGLLKRCVT